MKFWDKFTSLFNPRIIYNSYYFKNNFNILYHILGYTEFLF